MAVPPYVQGHDGTGRGRPHVDAARLWTGGLATALVAALVAVVGVLIARGLFDVPVLAPAREGALGNATTARLAILAGAGALLATGLMHLLLVSTPPAVPVLHLDRLAANPGGGTGTVRDRRQAGHAGRDRRHLPGDRAGDRLAGHGGGQERDPARKASSTASRALGDRFDDRW